MFKKLFVLLCLGAFVASMAACGGSKEGIRPGVKKEGAKPIGETYEETAETQVF